MDETLVAEFRDLIDSADATENAVQAFMETNTAFVPTPDLLNHRLHMNSIIAKFPIGGRKTDFAYLTKSSIEWRLVLVELEDSAKKIFKVSSKNHAFTAEFNDAVAQIDMWRDYVSGHLDQLREKLHPILVPPQMARNHLSVQYLLVIGRSSELENHEARRLRLSKYGEERSLRILTYDTVLRMVQDGLSKPKAVLRTDSNGYRLQSVEGMPNNMFAYVMPEHLKLAKSAEAALRKDNYDIDAWLNNDPLVFNEKWTFDSAPNLYDEMHASVKKAVLARKAN